MVKYKACQRSGQLFLYGWSKAWGYLINPIAGRCLKPFLLHTGGHPGYHPLAQQYPQAVELSFQTRTLQHKAAQLFVSIAQRFGSFPTGKLLCPGPLQGVFFSLRFRAR